MSRKEYPAPVYPPFPHGSAYIVSRDVGIKLKELQQRGQVFDFYFVISTFFRARKCEEIPNYTMSLKVQVWKLEDVSMGLWVRKLKEEHGMAIALVQEIRFLFHDKVRSALPTATYSLL